MINTYLPAWCELKHAPVVEVSFSILQADVHGILDFHIFIM
jgi:hypothetical protein